MNLQTSWRQNPEHHNLTTVARHSAPKQAHLMKTAKEMCRSVCDWSIHTARQVKVTFVYEMILSQMCDCKLALN
jgi:3-methyladenine DNA glycosylase AlkC